MDNMKNTLLLLAILCLISCSEDVVPVEPVEEAQELDYTGCWHEANSDPNYYDLIIADGYTLQLGQDCSPITAAVEGGYLRNDTLIFDLNTIEYWMHIDEDGMQYSYYGANAVVIFYEKSE